MIGEIGIPRRAANFTPSPKLQDEVSATCFCGVTFNFG
jgi:hypothetical protein